MANIYVLKLRALAKDRGRYVTRAAYEGVLRELQEQREINTLRMREVRLQFEVAQLNKKEQLEAEAKVRLLQEQLDEASRQRDHYRDMMHKGVEEYGRAKMDT
jgi:hypothetical protein